MAEIDDTPRSAELAESRLEFETLISDLSSRFINLQPSQVDGEIEDALRSVCELLGIDVAVLWQWSTVDAQLIAPTHAYPSLTGLQAPEPLHQEQFPWTVRQMRAARMVVINALAEMPAEAGVDQEHAHLAGIKSNLTIPLSVGGSSAVGALAFNTTRAARDWPDALVSRLQLIAQVFGNALARQRVDKAMRESEERLALAADSAEAGLWSLDYDTGVFWATGKARAIFGFLPEDVITMKRLEASVHPDDWYLVREVLERPRDADEHISVEYRILLGEGQTRWVSSQGRVHHRSTGKPDRLMGISVDISERRHSQEALRSSEARLEAGVDLAGLAFYEVDFGEDTVYVDDRFRDLCAVPRDQGQGLQALEFWMERLHPDDRHRVMDARRQLHEGRLEQLFVEYRFLPPGQGQKWVQHVARVAARDAAGRAVRSYGVLRDITERKRVEDELRDLSQRLIGAHEAERALLARELHDDVSQRLAVLAIGVGRAELVAPDGAQAEAMRVVREGLVDLSEDVHSLAYQLHSSILEEMGLVEALRAECERRGRQGRLDLALDLDPLPAIVTRNAALCLFR
ncbi:MAG TPA: PAS domain-containing protein, partial [Thermoleophilia bacterium]|nr:PAS domain-containing protein [Thermoleophilia bacterium]